MEVHKYLNVYKYLNKKFHALNYLETDDLETPICVLSRYTIRAT